MCNWRYAVHCIQLLWESLSEKNKTEQKSKGNATNSKDFLGGCNQHGHKKSKDKLIKVSLRFSSDLIAVSNLKSILH